MAKTLTANTATEKNKKTDIEPINLLEVEFGGLIGTKYFSDREVTVGGNTYEPIVADWGDIDFILNNTSTTTDISIKLINSTPSPTSDIFSIEAPESKVAKLYQWFGDLEAVDKTLIFNGRVTSPVKYNIDFITLDIVDRILDLKTTLGKVITVEEYPRSLPAHRGRVIPKVYGIVQNVPAVCIQTAGKSSLRETITDSATSIPVDDGTVFPTSGSWVMIIEEEQILMEPNPEGLNTLVATTRGYSGTTAVLHIKGVPFYEQLSEFKYQVFDDTGDVKANAISNVRVNGLLLEPTQYTIDQNTYPGQIIFSEYPQIDQEKETDFTDYLFDDVFNDDTVPYAQDAANLLDDDSNSATLNSGQRVTLRRGASLNNTNQYKRSFLVVRYKSDKDEWDGEITAKAYWDSNELGILPDPEFDPVLDDDITVLGNTFFPTIFDPYNPVGQTEYGNPDDMIPGPEAETVTETLTETLTPSFSEFRTEEYQASGYPWGPEDPTPVEQVPPSFFNVAVEGDIIKFHGMYRHAVINPNVWEADSALLRYIDCIFDIGDFSNEGVLTDLDVTFQSEIDPGTARAQIWSYRARYKGDDRWAEYTGFSLQDAFRQNKLTTTNLEMQVIIRVWTEATATPILSVGERSPVIVELFGQVYGLSTTTKTEVTREAPVQDEEPEPETPPVAIPEPTRESHEAEKIFEITEYVEEWGEILGEKAEIIFESDGAKPGTNLYILDFYIRTESGAYNFEYSDEITADVEGYYVDGVEITTDYGESGRVVLRPDLVFKLLLTWDSIFSLSDLDAESYAVAANLYELQAYRVDFAVVEQITLREVVEKMGFQVRTDQYWEAGIHKIEYLDVATSAIKQIDTSNIDTLDIERSNTNELINLLEVRYSINYSFLVEYTPDKFLDVITIENTTSQDDYGTRKNPPKDTTFNFEFVRDDTTASHVANYYLAFFSVIRRFVRFKCFLDQLELEKHDIIGLSYPLDGLSSTPGRVLSNKFNIGNSSKIDQFELYIMLEDYTYLKLEIGDSFTMADNLTVSIIPVVSISDSFVMSDAINFGFYTAMSDDVLIEDSLDLAFNRYLLIQDSTEGGWGNQAWGTSSWGGGTSSFVLDDTLTIERIIAASTGIVDLEEQISMLDELTLELLTETVYTDDNEFKVYFADSISVSIV